MSIQLLPDDYPLVYSDELRRWVDEDFYELISDESRAKMEKTLSYDYNRQDCIVFVTTQDILGIESVNRNLQYNIYFLEFGQIKRDIFIHNLGYICSTNTLPDFDSYGHSDTYASKEIKTNSEVRGYQQYERFYVGKKDTMSSIKDCIDDIVDNLWFNDDSYVPF